VVQQPHHRQRVQPAVAAKHIRLFQTNEEVFNTIIEQVADELAEMEAA